MIHPTGTLRTAVAAPQPAFAPSNSSGAQRYARSAPGMGRSNRSCADAQHARKASGVPSPRSLRVGPVEKHRLGVLSPLRRPTGRRWIRASSARGTLRQRHDGVGSFAATDQRLRAPALVPQRMRRPEIVGVFALGRSCIVRSGPFDYSLVRFDAEQPQIER
jgi:hypothetical protein